jgi:hypothetical protein
LAQTRRVVQSVKSLLKQENMNVDVDTINKYLGKDIKRFAQKLHVKSIAICMPNVQDAIKNYN